MSLLATLLLAAPILPVAAETHYADMVVDADTGEVLHASNVDNRNYPASLTKMMTLYLLFDDLESGKVRLTDAMPVSRHASAQAPSKLGLSPGQTLSVENGLLGLVTKSANDAAVTIAEYLAGSEPVFASRMTRKAHELGMSRTTFKNANGLPNSEQKTTARDMATLARALIHNHAREYHYFATRQFNYQGNVIANHNHLLEWYDGADGIKTGYIDASGFNLVASAKRDGRRLIGVVFGGQSASARDRQMAKLLDAGFNRNPGSSGVQIADLPEQADAETSAARTKAVMQAMRGSHGGGQTPVIERHPQAVGDTDDESWAIDLGSFAQAAKAKQVADAAQNQLGKLVEDGEAKASGAKKKGHHLLYQARIVGLNKDDAQKACHSLTRHHHACRTLNLG
jgi:D-alanyl-D-alanine carboxypeptidase